MIAGMRGISRSPRKKESVKKQSLLQGFSTIVIIALVLSVGFSQSARAAAPSSAPGISFEGQSISVWNVPAGHQVILFGVSRQPLGTAAVTLKRVLIQTAGAGGKATFTFKSNVSRASIFAAVDYETGAYTVATPWNYPLRLTLIPTKTLKKHGNAFDQLDLDRSEIDILCVRPKKGAWRVFLLDGSATDRDGKADDHIAIDALQFAKVDPSSDDIKDFHEHDVVIIIDSMRMDVMATEVGK
jgi:hypothetical protein